MADKPSLNTFSANSAVSVSKLNENFELLALAIQNSLGRGGINETPNSMQGDLDMNMYSLLNISRLSINSLEVFGKVTGDLNLDGNDIFGVGNLNVQTNISTQYIDSSTGTFDVVTTDNLNVSGTTTTLNLNVDGAVVSDLDLTGNDIQNVNSLTAESVSATALFTGTFTAPNITSDEIDTALLDTDSLIVNGIVVTPNETEPGVTGTSEIKQLTSGQVEVTFTNSVSNGVFYVTGANVDGERLVPGSDYTTDVVNNKVTLSNSYPAGTRLWMVIFEDPVDIAASQIVYADTHNRLDGASNIQDAIDKAAITFLTESEILGLSIDADTLDGNEGTYYLDWTNTTNKPSPTITLDGDVTGNVTLADLQNGTITCTVVDDSHNHTIANVDGLQADLDSKEDASNKGVANGYAGLDSNAKVKLDQLPDVSKQRTYVLLSTDPRPTDPYEGDRLFETDTGDSYIFDGAAWTLMADADWENVNLEWSNINNIPSPQISLSGDATGSATMTELGSADITVTVADDSHNHIIDNVDGLQTALDGKADTVHTHTFDSLTSKDQGTGDYETTGRFVSGKDSGETAIEDGAITFNHTGTIPDQSGNSGRISVNVDAAGTATLTVGLGSNVTAGTVASLIDALTLTASGLSVNGDITSQTGILNGTASDSDLLEGQTSAYHLDWTNTTNKPSPTLTLTGDASGQATFTELGDATLDVTVSGISGSAAKIVDTQTLSSGQTTVTTTVSVASDTPVSVSSPDVGGRLLIHGVDYTLPDANTIELTESYPDGTYLLIGA